MFYTTSRHGYEFIKNKIAKLNRIAEKIGQAPILFEFIKSELVTDPHTMISSMKYYIMCIGEAPKLKDWKFMATLDFTPKGNIFNLTYNPDKADALKIPERFKTTQFTLCEDCGVERYRTSVFILHNEKIDKWMQVGSTCLGSFLGVNESEVYQLAEFASTLASMPKVMQKWIDKTNNSKKNNSYYGYSTVNLLAAMFSSVRKEWEQKNPRFWLSSSVSYARYRILSYLKNSNDEDVKNAEKVVKYFREEYKVDASNYYSVIQTNMVTAMKNDVLAKKHYKFAQRAFSEYMKIFGDAIFPRIIPEPVKTIVESLPMAVTVVPAAPVVTPCPIATTPLNGFVGVIGQPLPISTPLQMKVKFARKLMGNWGAFTMVVMNDDGGHEYLWANTRKQEYKVGDVINVKSAIVKKHQLYNNTKQTVIGKVSF